MEWAVQYCSAKILAIDPDLETNSREKQTDAIDTRVDTRSKVYKVHRSSDAVPLRLAALA